MRKNILLHTALMIFFFGLVQKEATVFAVTTPSFPSCPNPGGEVIASYADGTHGVPGDQNTYTGSDTVFKLNGTQVVQCLCTNTSDIQTNWLKISQYSEDDISILENQGWVFVPNGSLWGLDESAYMAKNKAISCDGGTGGGDTSTSTETKSSGGSVLGAATGQVLGAYAATGSSIQLVSIALLSLLSFICAWVLRRRTQ